MKSFLERALDDMRKKMEKERDLRQSLERENRDLKAEIERIKAQSQEAV